LLFVEDLLDLGHLGQRDLVFLEMAENHVDLRDHVFATSDGVVVRLVEAVGGGVQELHKVLGREFGYNAVSILCGDEQLVVTHCC
jgi:hypothetical protein